MYAIIGCLIPFFTFGCLCRDFWDMNLPQKIIFFICVSFCCFYTFLYFYRKGEHKYDGIGIILSKSINFGHHHDHWNAPHDEKTFLFYAATEYVTKDLTDLFSNRIKKAIENRKENNTIDFNDIASIITFKEEIIENWDIYKGKNITITGYVNPYSYDLYLLPEIIDYKLIECEINNQHFSCNRYKLYVKLSEKETQSNNGVKLYTPRREQIRNDFVNTKIDIWHNVTINGILNLDSYNNLNLIECSIKEFLDTKNWIY